MYIKLDDIIPNRFQPREVFDEEALNKLADSIRQHGVIEPILVRPVSNKYEIVAGERRYKASVIAGLTKIPAMVRQLDDKESSIVAFIENEHRSDVSAVEEARTMDRILKNNNMTQEELAKELGVNQSTIANKLRLLNLPLEVQESLMKNEISERHARSLLSVKDEEKQIELLNKIKEKRMTVRELDSEIKNMNENMNNFNEPKNDYVGAFPGENNNPVPGDFFNVGNTTATPDSTPAEDPGFMSFLNNYDNNNPTPAAELNEQTPTATPEGNDFRNILNNYDNPAPAAEPTTEEKGFMDFINSLDNKPAEPTSPVASEANAPKEDSGFMDFLNNYDNNNPVSTEPASSVAPEASAPKEDPGFMDFLNNYDSSNPVSTEPTSPVAPEASTPKEDPGFMDFLNNYDSSNPVSTEPTNPESPEEPETSGGTQNAFSYDVPPVENNLYENFNTTTNNNVAINDVTPPITSDFSNQYIENTANYVDVSKKEKITSVDEIINKVGAVVKEIKDKSVFKIDTEEINYDDIYQITIKIDKRDF